MSAYGDLDRMLAGDVRALLRAPKACVWLAYVAGELAGYLTARFNLEPERVLSRRACFEEWFVVPAQRGQGVGRALMQAFEVEARSRDCALLETTTWAAYGEARARYARLGFEEVQLVLRKPLAL